VARVRLQLAGGRVVSFGMRVRASGVPAVPDSGGIQLGRIPAADAAKLLLALAARGGADGEEVVAAASVADSATAWPELLGLARNTHLAPDTRRAAIFWLGQAAGEAATRGLDSIATDSGTDRRTAVFWLGQTDDPRAVALFEEIPQHSQPSVPRRCPSRR
jgi:HEAT repeat protein